MHPPERIVIITVKPPQNQSAIASMLIGGKEHCYEYVFSTNQSFYTNDKVVNFPFFCNISSFGTMRRILHQKFRWALAECI